MLLTTTDKNGNSNHMQIMSPSHNWLLHPLVGLCN